MRIDRLATRGAIGYYRTPKQWRFEFWWRIAVACAAALVFIGAWYLAPIIGLPEW